MSKPNQLMFEGKYLMTEIAPGLFKLEEPCVLDIDKWIETHISNSFTLLFRENTVYYVSVSDIGDDSILAGIAVPDWSKYSIFKPARISPNRIGGLFEL